MKRIYRSILTYFRENQGIFIFMILVIIAGFICGSLLVRFIADETLKEIVTSLNYFLTDLKQDTSLLAAPELLRSSFYKNGMFLLLLWVLGLFSAGFIFIPLILFMKGVSLGFTAGVLIYRYTMKGLLFSLAALFPHSLLLIPSYLLSASFAFAYSIYLFRHRLYQGKNNDIFLVRYNLYMVVMMFLAFAGILVEAYITPVFMRLVVPVF